ncbi:hypothetical protein ACFRCG_06975 [Embleya sp. NPDC056575]|uniref:hypothetical protein n=1 Tax=unclassified Embleya TaxID=2699296 RepID=UPI0036801E36
MVRQYAVDDDCGGGWRVEDVDGTRIRQRFSEDRIRFLPPMLWERLAKESPSVNLSAPQYLMWIADKAEEALFAFGKQLQTDRVRDDDPAHQMFATWMATRAVVMDRQVLVRSPEGRLVWIEE